MKKNVHVSISQEMLCFRGGGEVGDLGPAPTFVGIYGTLGYVQRGNIAVNIIVR